MGACEICGAECHGRDRKTCSSICAAEHRRRHRQQRQRERDRGRKRNRNAAYKARRTARQVARQRERMADPAYKLRILARRQARRLADPFHIARCAAAEERRAEHEEWKRQKAELASLPRTCAVCDDGFIAQSRTQKRCDDCIAAGRLCRLTQERRVKRLAQRQALRKKWARDPDFAEYRCAFYRWDHQRYPRRNPHPKDKRERAIIKELRRLGWLIGDELVDDPSRTNFLKASRRESKRRQRDANKYFRGWIFIVDRDGVVMFQEMTPVQKTAQSKELARAMQLRNPSSRAPHVIRALEQLGWVRDGHVIGPDEFKIERHQHTSLEHDRQ